MKFLHISDLHIGKRVHEFSMIEDQKYILEQILEITQKEQADAVVIAGDIYDRPVPSAEAVALFDDFLTRLSGICRVFAVSGNHDSPERIAFGSRLMREREVYFSPVYNGEVEPVRIADEFGEVCVYLMPFIKPAAVRHALEIEEISSYQDAVTMAVERLQLTQESRNVLVAHQFVTGASRCDSEEVAVGGLDNVDVSVFDGFDYVALGHIHSPQNVGRDTVRYCGTPLKYSFSEAEQIKSVTVVELFEKGNVKVGTIPLTALHDLRKIRGTYLEVTSRSFYAGTSREDYLQVTLTDEEDVPDGLQKLRVIYPNLMLLSYDNCRTRQDQETLAVQAAVHKTPLENFEDFYEMQNNQPMSEEQRRLAEQMFRFMGEGKQE